MPFLRSLMLSILCISGIASAATPHLNESVQDLQLVPFNGLIHGKQARRIYESAFRCPGNHPHALNSNYSGHEKVLVLTDGCKVIGVIIYVDKYLNGQTIRCVSRLAVDPALHCQGYGSILIKKFELMTQQEGASLILLDSLPRAIPFYQRNGFCGCGYGNLMKKELDQLQKPDFIQSIDHDSTPRIQMA